MAQVEPSCWSALVQELDVKRTRHKHQAEFEPFPAQVFSLGRSTRWARLWQAVFFLRERLMAGRGRHGA